MRPMGQLVGVVERPSSAPGVVRFELNRSLSGMGHERFTSVLDAIGPRPSAALARDLFATGKVAGVHVYGNMVTVSLASNDPVDLGAVLSDLYTYYVPGVEIPDDDELIAMVE